MIWNAVVPGVILLGIVIFVHELGHFLMAKWRGVRVLRFSLGFGPAMWAFQRGGTEYRIAWFPLGGYVQMAGDAPDEEGGMPGEPDEFLSHSWFGRLLIAIAGPAANFVTAMLVMIVVGLVGVSYPDYPNRIGALPDSSRAYQAGLRQGDEVVALNGKPVSSWIGIFMANSNVAESEQVELELKRGEGRKSVTLQAEEREPVFLSLRRDPDPPVVGSVVVGMPAYKAGMRRGDRITAVNGTPIRDWEDLPQALRGTVDKRVTLAVEREGRALEIVVTPINPEGRGTENARIGIEPPRQGTYVDRHGVLESVDLGVRATFSLVGSVYSGMWLTVSRPLYYREYVGGPLFIAQAASEQARRGLDSYLQFLAMINIAIMAFNLMPLPMLDGGHIVLALLQAVRRQALSGRAYIRFQKAGLVVLGTLLVLILANDPLRLVQRQRALDRTSSSAPQEELVAPSPP